MSLLIYQSRTGQADPLCTTALYPVQQSQWPSVLSGIASCVPCVVPVASADCRCTSYGFYFTMPTVTLTYTASGHSWTCVLTGNSSPIAVSFYGPSAFVPCCYWENTFGDGGTVGDIAYSPQCVPYTYSPNQWSCWKNGVTVTMTANATTSMSPFNDQILAYFHFNSFTICDISTPIYFDYVGVSLRSSNYGSGGFWDNGICGSTSTFSYTKPTTIISSKF